MNISKLALIALLGSALMAFGCSDSTSSGGSGGSAGSGGSGGSAGSGGDGGTGGVIDPLCQATEAECGSVPVDPIDENCESTIPTPPDADDCVGDEAVVNPESCTALENGVTVTITQLQVNGSCDAGYNLDSCTGHSCVVGSFALGEGVDGVDNALGGLGPILAGLGNNLNGVDQALYDGICDGGIAIAFTIDANVDENCAVVEILDADGAVDRTINMHLSDAGCISGTIGAIPLNVAGNSGQMSNATLRATLSAGGLSNGTLGVTIDEETAAGIANELVDGGAAIVGQVLDINEDLSGDTANGCDSLSATFTIGGVTPN